MYCSRIASSEVAGEPGTAAYQCLTGARAIESTGLQRRRWEKDDFVYLPGEPQGVLGLFKWQESILAAARRSDTPVAAVTRPSHFAGKEEQGVSLLERGWDH